MGKKGSGEYLRNLGFLGVEFGTEVAPFVGEAVKLTTPLVAFLMERIPAGVVLVGSRIGQFGVVDFDAFCESGLPSVT